MRFLGLLRHCQHVIFENTTLTQHGFTPIYSNLHRYSARFRLFSPVFTHFQPYFQHAFSRLQAYFKQVSRCRGRFLAENNRTCAHGRLSLSVVINSLLRSITDFLGFAPVLARCFPSEYQQIKQAFSEYQQNKILISDHIRSKHT